MMPRAWIGCLVAAALATPAAAQQRILFGVQGDTAVGVRSGGGRLRIEAEGYYPRYYGMTAARLVLHYDPTKLLITGIDTPTYGFTSVSLLPGAAGTDTVRASGATVYETQAMFSLRVQLQPGVTDGTWIWASPESLLVPAFGELSGSTVSAIGQVCHATYLYGDVDHNDRVDSRDALITLSAAVGLPVSGFDIVGLGDADGDGLANSRDALMMLSYAIGYPSSAHLGQGAPDGCPGFGTASERLVFQRLGGGQQSLHALAPGGGTSIAVPNTAGPMAGAPRLAADDTSIVYECQGPFGYTQICLISRSGSGPQLLTVGLQNNRSPDWSPDNRTVFYRGGAIPTRLDSVGAPPVALIGVSISGDAVTVSRDGARVAYAVWYTGLSVVNADGSGDMTTPSGVTNAIDLIRWAPGDTAFALTVNGYPGVWTLPAAGGVAVRHAPIEEIDGLDWGPDGIVFSGNHGVGRFGLWLLRPSGVLDRLTAGDDHQPSFRRTP